MRRGIMSFLLIIFLLMLDASIPTYAFQNEIEKKEDLAQLDRNRWYWQQPSKIMDAIGIGPGMVVADVGAGYGYFTLGMACLVGEEGKVYANEIDEHCLQVIQQECNKEKIKNVIPILGREDDPRLPEGEMDIVFMVNVLHYFEENEERIAFLKKIIPSLKSRGTLAIVQWKRDRVAGRRSPMVYEENIRQSGYEVVRNDKLLSQQVLFICRLENKSQD